jgi:beta-glucanase (GH16 family)
VASHLQLGRLFGDVRLALRRRVRSTQQRRIFETIHFVTDDKADGEGVSRPMPNGAHADDGFHVYGFEWLPDQMIFYIDGVEVYRQSRAIDKKMYLLVNLSIGGGWPGDPDDSTPWPAQMQLDYVRAFSQTRPDSVSGPR